MKARFVGALTLGICAALSPSASATVITLDQSAAVTTGTATYFGPSTSQAKPGMLNQDGMHVSGAGASATFTPGASGTYNLWADWHVVGLGTTTTYAINYAGGTATVNVNPGEGPGQGATGSWYAGSTPSGYYYLGQYTLNSASTVVVTNSNNDFYMDCLRLATPDDIFIVDEHAALAGNTANWTSDPASYGASSLGKDPNLGWGWDPSTAAATLTYYPNVTASGAKIKLSWSCNSGGSANTAVKYYFSANGTGTDKVLLATINDNFDNGQVSGPSGWNWSGFYTVSGTYNLTTSSTIILDTNGSSRTSADVIGLVLPVPEPGTWLLIGTGSLLALGYIRRRQIR